MKIKVYVSIIITIILSIALFFLLQALLVPKYMTSLYEGRMTSEYYNETREHDILFIGDCEVYSSYSPIALWEDYGITSYIRGNSQQMIWQSCYLLEEALKRETPKAVIYNVLAMRFAEPDNEAYNRLTLDGMRLSPLKIKAVRASMTEGEQLITYIFPLLRYHSRWSGLGNDDFRYLFGKKQITHNGFLMKTGVKPADTYPSVKPLADYSLPDISWSYLDKMLSLCKDNGVKLILVKSPCLYPHWYKEWDEQVKAYAEKNDIDYINLIPLSDEIGIDMSEDTYDGGLHLNLNGAEKLTRWFGAWLDKEYGPFDHAGDKELERIWAEKSEFYHKQAEIKVTN
jgi:hypothetical protein